MLGVNFDLAVILAKVSVVIRHFQSRAYIVEKPLNLNHIIVCAHYLSISSISFLTSTAYIPMDPYRRTAKEVAQGSHRVIRI